MSGMKIFPKGFSSMDGSPSMEELHQVPEPPMIEKLFASPALYATLAIFFDYPCDPLFPRLISRYTGTGIKSVLRELKKLHEIGIVRSRGAGKERHYWLNEDFPLHEELASIFDKTRRYRRYLMATAVNAVNFTSNAANGTE
jgi:hypothetical protein